MSRYVFVRGEGRKQGKARAMNLIVEALRAAGHEVTEMTMADAATPPPKLIADDPLLRVYLGEAGRRGGDER